MHVKKLSVILMLISLVSILVPVHALADEGPFGQYEDADYPTLFAAAAESDGAYAAYFGGILGDRLLTEPIELLSALALEAPDVQARLIDLTVASETLFFEQVDTVAYLRSITLPENATDAERDLLERMIWRAEYLYDLWTPNTGDGIVPVAVAMVFSGYALLWLMLQKKRRSFLS